MQRIDRFAALIERQQIILNIIACRGQTVKHKERSGQHGGGSVEAAEVNSGLECRWVGDVCHAANAAGRDATKFVSCPGPEAPLRWYSGMMSDQPRNWMVPSPTVLALISPEYYTQQISRLRQH